MKLNEQNTKLHYKMYKSGKKWLISGITTAVMVISISDFASHNQASANDQVGVQENQNNVNSITNTVTSVSSNTQSSSVDSSKATTSTSSNVQSSSVDSSKATTSTSNDAQSSSVDSSKATTSTSSNADSSSVDSSKATTSASSNADSSSVDSSKAITSASSNADSSSVDSSKTATSTSSNAQSSSVDSSKTATSSQSADSSSASDSESNTSEISNRMLDSSNDTIKSLPSGGSYVTTDGGKTYKYVYQNSPLKGLYNDNGKLVYFDGYDGTQARGVVYNIDNSNYIFDKNSGDGTKIDEISGGQYRQANANDGQNSTPGAWVYQQTNNLFAKGIQNIDGNLRYFDAETGSQLKGGTAEIAGADYYFEPSQGDLIGNVDQIVNNGKYVNSNGNNQYVDSSSNPVKGLTSVNNSLQYFDNNGNQVKNQQVITNGATYYFDDSGNGQYLFTNTGNSVSTDTSQHNVANSTDPNDYKNTVDGFLTADSWYRPKDILDGGTTWRASNGFDYRPIITTWWPNKDIQVNYLKLMQDNGLLSNDVQYSRLSDQTVLDQAAQTAQVSIEQKIKQANSTDWLNNLLFQGSTSNPSFVNKQYIWNMDSESAWAGQSWFQGGYLKYGNNPLTPTTNSDYRQSDNIFEFLLANDVDNSNPVVQADNLNWLYYMTHFGSITANNNNANFDSIRLDAVDLVSNSANQRAYDYMKEEYGLGNNDATSNKHISLVEGGLEAGTTSYNNNALTESPFRVYIMESLFNAPGKNASLSNLLKEYDSSVLVNDHVEGENIGYPTYSIVHAHDKGIQEAVGNAITDSTGANWTNFTPEQLQQGLNLYYQDQNSSIKKYNSYNIPSSYALMLTNNGTVPRVYYGDLYDDNGQYMQNKSIYYDAITRLMEARKQYVAGGQSMNVDSNGLLTSVRYGNGANVASDAGNQETRTEGMGLIVGNDPSVSLKDSDTVTLNMGVAHANQEYRALLLTTKDGIQTYDSDANAPVAYTDNNGNLTFSNKDINNQANTSIQGILNPQVSGYLAAWVPTGASTSQDVRVAPSTDTTTDGKILHSNAALNSNLIYEGFSNFQPEPTTYDERANVVIAKNAPLFNQWGVTSFEMAPQYNSTNDHTFLDSTINNGYAFTDRYDVGMTSPTKYGDAADLRNAIQTLHQNGMQVMADIVFNQVYNLPGHEVVSANRAGVVGQYINVPFGTQLYVTNTVGGGVIQQQYAGAFLNQLKSEHPDLFNAKSFNYYYQNYSNNGLGPAYLITLQDTMPEIPSDQPLKQWSAKYMNGTNILGRGMGYVLKDWNTGNYFKINGNSTTLPATLSADSVYRHGWAENGDGTWSYYDDSGNRLLGNQTVNGQNLYFNTSGIQVKGNWGENPDGTWSYYDKDSGSRLTGNQIINGQNVFFNSNGVQVKGDWGENPDGTWSYYDQNSGERFTGLHEIDGQNVYFDENGIQSKGKIVNINGKSMYFDANSGSLATNTKLTINGVNYDADVNGVLSVQNDSSNSDNSNSASEAASASASTAASIAASKSASEASSASASTANSIAASKSASEAASASASTANSIAASKSASEAASASASTANSIAASKSASEAASASASTANSIAASKSASEAASASASTANSIAASKSASEAASASASTANSIAASKSASEAASASASTEASLASSKAASEAAAKGSTSSSNASSASSSTSSSTNSSSAISSSSASNSTVNTGTTTNTGNTVISTGGYVATTTTNSSSSSSATSSASSSATSSVASSASSSAISSASISSATSSSSSVEDGSNVISTVDSNKAKAAMIKAQNAVKVAEKLKNQTHSKTHVKNYNKALDNYYLAEKQYLTVAKLYNSKYYYNFDKVTKHSKYVKLSKSAYVYDSKKFSEDNRVSKVKKGTKVKVNKIVRDDKTTRFNIGHNKFITGLKSFIHKLIK